MKWSGLCLLVAVNLFAQDPPYPTGTLTGYYVSQGETYNDLRLDPGTLSDCKLTSPGAGLYECKTNAKFEVDLNGKTHAIFFQQAMVTDQLSRATNPILSINYVGRYSVKDPLGGNIDDSVEIYVSKKPSNPDWLEGEVYAPTFGAQGGVFLHWLGP